MIRSKYKLNPETLLFERIRYSFRHILIRSLPILISVTIFSLFIMFLGHDLVVTPKLKELYETQEKIEMQLQLLKGEIGRMGETVSCINYNDDNIYRTYFEVDALPGYLREAGFGGNENELVTTSEYRKILNEINHSLNILTKKIVVQSRSFDYVIELTKTKEKRLAARPAIQPVSTKDLIRFGSSFGMRMHPILKVNRMHEGIDLTCPKGTKVFATADGVIINAGYSPGGLGIRILIDHGFGYKTIYGHLEKVFIKEGEKVKRGDVIGLVGSTGLSLQPHLHYEIIANGKKANPINYYANDLTAEEYDKMIQLLSYADPNFDIN